MPQKDARHRSIGPFAPPLPSEAEREEAEPMAVANDKQTPQDAFLPTSAPLDAYDPEVARKWAQHPEKMVTRSREENKAAENPPGYTEVNERGYRELKDDADKDLEGER